MVGKTGIMYTSHGLRIACCGGAYDDAKFFTTAPLEGDDAHFLTSQDVDTLLSHPSLSAAATREPQTLASARAAASAATSASTSSKHVDILLTSLWPEPITHLSANVPAPPLPPSTSVLDRVVTAAKPRYHFCGAGGIFWEREPYVWDGAGGSDPRATRFVSLGAFGELPGQMEGVVEEKPKKQRWFYAFSIAPMTAGQAVQPRPPNATMSPFVTARFASKRGQEDFDAGDGGENFIWGNAGKRPKRGMCYQLAVNHVAAPDLSR